MLEKVSMGLGLAVMAMILPSELSLPRQNLPVIHVHHNDGFLPSGNQEAVTSGDFGGPTAMRVSVGALYLNHRMFYLHRVTAYNAVNWQTDSDPDVSACGPTRPNQIALSQDLFFRRNGNNRCGEHVEIVLGSGAIIHGIVWDTMNPRYHMAADILMGTVRQAVNFGVQQAELRIVRHQQVQSLSS